MLTVGCRKAEASFGVLTSPGQRLSACQTAMQWTVWGSGLPLFRAFEEGTRILRGHYRAVLMLLLAVVVCFMKSKITLP